MTTLRPLTEQEQIIYNNGECLIPGVTHGVDEIEIQLHTTSYRFFRRLIEADALTISKHHLSILDLGCGVGHGCVELVQLPWFSVYGIDRSLESIEYARQYYSKTNIEYACRDITEITRNPNTFLNYDYVVSRGVLEHIEGASALIPQIPYNRMLIFDVPYDEPPGRNPHHVWHNITEADFPDANAIYYETFDGITAEKPANPILIMAVYKHG